MVFSWSGCPFCKKAKALLDQKGAKYTVLELDQMDDGQRVPCCPGREDGTDVDAQYLYQGRRHRRVW